MYIFSIWKWSICIADLQIVHLTGKNDHMWYITPWEAVFWTVICSIFGEWHCEVLWTYTLSILLCYACDIECWIIYILLSTSPKQATRCTSLHAPKYAMKYSPDWTGFDNPSLHTLLLPVCSQATPKRTSSVLLSLPPCMLRRMLTIALDSSLPHKISRCSEAYSSACSHGRFHLHSMADS